MSKFGMNFASLLTQIDSVNTKKTGDEDEKDYWKLTKDKEGNGSAIIRFLPNKELEDFPFVRIYSHGFKDASTGRWYIERSLSTIGEMDYIAEVNRELWNTGLESNKKIVQQRKRRMQYVSNILVIKDAAHPENEGKIFKFKYGKSIFDKIVAAAKPEPVENEDGEQETAEEINAFDPIEGASFSLKQTIVDKFPNFDSSTFLKKKPILNGDEEKIEELFKGLYELKDELQPSKFKSYDELKKKFLWTIGEETGDAPKSKPKTAKSAPTDDVDETLDGLEKAAEKLAVKAQKTVAKPPVPTAVDNDDDEDSFFKSLIED